MCILQLYKYMVTDRINVNLQTALTNIIDAMEAEEGDPNIEYFKQEAKNAFEEVPQDFPYVEQYNSALDKRDFEQALDELDNFASYLEAYDDGEYSFTYTSSEIDRIHDTFHSF